MSVNVHLSSWRVKVAVAMQKQKKIQIYTDLKFYNSI